MRRGLTEKMVKNRISFKLYFYNIHLQMAEAGFYLVGSQSEPDLVRCYYCRRELDGWEPQDIPWDEHKRRDCPYITLGKLPQDLTVEDAFQLEGERKCIIVVNNNWFDF